MTSKDKFPISIFSIFLLYPELYLPYRLISLTPLSPGVVLGLDDGCVSLGYEPSVSLGFPQDTTHLHHSLKTVQ